MEQYHPAADPVSADGDLLFTAIPENIYMDADLLEDAKQLDGVAAMTPQFYAQTLALSCCEPGEEARIIGYDSDSDFILRPYLPVENQNGITAEEMIVGHNFADDDLVGYNYLVLGQKFKVVAMLEPTGTGMDATLFADIDTVRQMCLESEVLAAGWTVKDPYDYISIIILAVAIVALLSKKGYRNLMIVNAVAGVVLFLVFTKLIGVCASEEMRCQITKLWGMGCAAAVTVSSLIDLVSGKEGQVPG